VRTRKATSACRRREGEGAARRGRPWRALCTARAQGMGDGSVHVPDLGRLCSGFGQSMGPMSCIKYLQLEANSNFAEGTTVISTTD
jgi:hypothetical protein